MRHVRVVLIYTVIIILLYFFIKTSLEEYKILEIIRRIRPIHFGPQLILAFLFGLINYFIYNQTLKLFKINLSFKEWYGLGIINTLTNYIFPFKMGVAIKALYLKNKHNFSIAQNTSILIYSSYLFFQMISALAFVTFIYMKLTNVALEHLNLFLISSFILTSAGIIFTLIIKKISVPNDHHVAEIGRIFRIINLFLDGLKIINYHTRLLVLLACANILIFLIQSLRLYYAYLAIDVHPSFLDILFVNLLYCFSSLLSITPGNLGIQEIILSFASSMIGLTKEEGLVAAGIIRVTALGIISVLSVFFYFSLNLHKFPRRKTK